MTFTRARIANFDSGRRWRRWRSPYPCRKRKPPPEITPTIISLGQQLTESKKMTTNPTLSNIFRETADATGLSAANENRRRIALRLAAAPFALVLGLAQVGPAYALMSNTVTVDGTGPSGPVTTSDTEDVDVENAAASISIAKTTTFPAAGDTDSDGFADPGETISYSYTVTNNGNVTLADVTMTDAHQGFGALVNGAFPVVYTDGGQVGGSLDDNADANWDSLGPGDSIVFTSSYVVQAGDISNNGGGDGDIDNTATASGDYTGGPYTANSSVAVPLDVAPQMTVTKVADDTTDVALGQVITYTYTVSNTGNVPITNVTLTDVHNGSGPDPVPAFSSWTAQNGSTVLVNTITTFEPGSIAVFTAPYTVTQSDIDTLQ
jgi:large repetitive protein